MNGQKLFTRSKSLTAISCSRLRFENQFAFRLSRSVRILCRDILKAYSLLSDSGSDSQPIINSRPLVDGEFDYTAKPSRRSFPGLPDFRDRLPCRLTTGKLKSLPDHGGNPKGRGFDSHRGQANFAACPVWMHTQSSTTKMIYCMRLSMISKIIKADA